MPTTLVKVEKTEIDEQNAATVETTMAAENRSEENSIKDPAIGTGKAEAVSTKADNFDSLGDGSYPFDDPVQRTRCLMQYIRLRNQRAEAEQAKRNALKKQKMDAQATLQNARDELAQAEAEKRHWERKADELNQDRHQVLNSLKALHQRETERKRQREEAERQRRQLEEQQQRLAAAAAAAAQQQQQQSTAVLDAYLQQLKNVALSPWFSTGNTAGNAVNSSTITELLAALPPSVAQLLLSSAVSSTTTGNSAPSAPSTMPSSSSTASSSLMSALVAATVQAQQQQGHIVSTASNQQYANPTSFGPLTQQQQVAAAHQQQQQQVQNAVASLLRHHFPSGTAATLSNPQPGTSTAASLSQSNYPTTAAVYLQQQQFEQLQSQLAAVTQQQLPGTLSIQTALAAAVAAAGVGGILPSPNSAATPQPALVGGGPTTITNLTPELIYQAAMLAAAGIGTNPTAAGLSSNPVTNLSSSQQQHK